MRALGLIETRGLIAAIESADVMLKSSEVTLIDKTYVGGGLVSIAVTGDVAAVKSAVDAGAASVTHLNASLLVSQHVIPRPNDEIDDFFLLTKVRNTKPKESKAAAISKNTGSNSIEQSTESLIQIIKDSNAALKEPEPEEPIVEQLVPEVLVTDEAIALVPIAANSEENEIIAEILMPDDSSNGATERKQTSTKAASDLNLDEVNKAYVDKMVADQGVEKTIDFLSNLRVTKLRNLAREYVNFGISGRTISRADGKTLISEFKQYYESLKERS